MIHPCVPPTGRGRLLPTPGGASATSRVLTVDPSGLRSGGDERSRAAWPDLPGRRGPRPAAPCGGVAGARGRMPFAVACRRCRAASSLRNHRSRGQGAVRRGELKWMSAALASLLEGLLGSCGLDHVEDRSRGSGSTLFVSDQPFVVASMTRCALLVDRVASWFWAAEVGGVAADAGCQDDQWLVGEVPQGCGFLRRGIRLDVLVDRAAKVVCGRDAGADSPSERGGRLPEATWA